jgi:hypothetical protein
MEYNFANACRLIAQHFANLADAYEKDKRDLTARCDYLTNEVGKNNEVKRKILAVLQEDLDD